MELALRLTSHVHCAPAQRNCFFLNALALRERSLNNKFKKFIMRAFQANGCAVITLPQVHEAHCDQRSSAHGFYVGVGWACRPSPVLLFESKPIRSLLYESLTMYSVRQHSEIAILRCPSPQETVSRADISLIVNSRKSALMRQTLAQT